MRSRWRQSDSGREMNVTFMETLGTLLGLEYY